MRAARVLLLSRHDRPDRTARSRRSFASVDGGTMTDLPIVLTLDDLLVHHDWEARVSVRGAWKDRSCLVVEHTRDPGLAIILWANWLFRPTLSQPLKQALTRSERRRVVRFAREVARMRLMLAAIPQTLVALPAWTR